MRVRVRRHLRRRQTKEPEAAVRAAVHTLERLNAAKDLESVCHVELSKQDSQVLPPPGGFRRGHCSIVNIEPADVKDEVECVTTLEHEAIHTRDVMDRGEDGINKKAEILAHHKTIGFLQQWSKREKTGRSVWCSLHKRDEEIRNRIAEVVDEEHDSIKVLEAEDG